MGLTPRVHKSCIEQGTHAVDFLLGVARGFVVIGFGPSQINRRVCHIQIATTNHRLVRIEFLQVIPEGLVPRAAKGQALEA